MIKSEINTTRLRETIHLNTKLMFPFKTNQEAKIKELKNIRAVFFDVYGTMLISGTGDIGISEEKNNQFPISRILSEHSYTKISSDENIDERFSQLLINLIKNDHLELKEKGIDYPEVNILQIWKRILTSLISENYIKGKIVDEDIPIISLKHESMVNPVWPMSGIQSVLNHLYNKKYKLGIISNAQFYTEEILKTLFNFKVGSEFFDPQLLFYSYMEKRAKPSKDFFMKAVTRIKKLYNIESDEILYIGNDMLNDIYTASACGCKTALFAGDQRSLRLRTSEARCKNIEPDLIITELKQLINIL